MTHLLKIDINNIEIERFTKLLSKLDDSDYTIWQGRILHHKTKNKKYSYENLLNIFKSLKEKPDVDADKLENLRSKLLKLDKAINNSFSKKTKEFFHAVVSHLKGTYTDKEDILDIWLVQDSDENHEPENQNEGQNSDTYKESSTKNNETIPVELIKGKETIDFYELDDEDSSSEEDLSDAKTSNFTEPDQLDQENFGTEKQDQAEPGIVITENINENVNEPMAIDQPLPFIKTPEVSLENSIIGPFSTAIKTADPKQPSIPSVQGYTRWHLFGVGLITIVATVIFEKLIKSQLPGAEVFTPNTCPIPNSLLEHRLSYGKLCSTSPNNQLVFDAIHNRLQERDQFKVSNKQLEMTNKRLNTEVLNNAKILQELSKGTKGLNDPQILLEIENDTNSMDIEVVKSALLWINKIAKNNKITGDALSKNAIQLVEKTIQKFLISEDSSLQLKALQALFALYDKKDYVINTDFELHTLFFPLISLNKMGKDNLPHLAMLIGDAKFASDEIRKASIKNFIMKLNRHEDLVDENQMKFFDDLLQEHLVQTGDIQSAITTVEDLINKGKKTRALAILANMLTGFDEQEVKAKIEIYHGILTAVKEFDDLKLLNQLFEKLESLDSSLQTPLINTVNAIPLKLDDTLGNLNILLKRLDQLNAKEAHLKISKAMLEKIQNILQDRTAASGKKITILNEFLNGFDTLHVDLENELVFMTGKVSSNEIEWDRDASLNLLNNLLRLKSFGAFFQIPETLLKGYANEAKSKIIFIIEQLIKETDRLTLPLEDTNKSSATTLLARMVNKYLTSNELHKISMITKKLCVPKLTDYQKTLLIDRDKELFITDYTLKTYVKDQSAADAQAMIDYITYSQFENTDRRLRDFAKLLLEIGTNNYVYAISESDYEKHGVALDILASLAPKIQGEEFIKFLENALTQSREETKISKGLYPKSIKLMLAMLKNKPSHKLLVDSHDHIRKMSFAEFAKQYPIDSRTLAFKDYVAVFKTLLLNRRFPSSSPILEYITNVNEKIDVKIARSLLNIVTIANDQKNLDFPEKLNENNNSILNRLEQDLNASPAVKMSVYKEYMEAKFIRSTKADILRIKKLCQTEMKKSSNQKTLEEMVDILDTIITPTAVKDHWTTMISVLSDLKQAIPTKGAVIDGILKRLA